MKPKEDETYESWVQRARLYEQGIAMQKLAEGEDPSKVLDEFSRRLIEKFLNPLYKSLHKSVEKTTTSEQDRINYRDNYLSKIQPRADHVDEK